MTEKQEGELLNKVSDMHRAIFGNGQPGMFNEFQKAKGAIEVLKWLIGGGVLMSVAAIVITFIKK